MFRRGGHLTEVSNAVSLCLAFNALPLQLVLAFVGELIKMNCVQRSGHLTEVSSAVSLCLAFIALALQFKSS